MPVSISDIIRVCWEPVANLLQHNWELDDVMTGVMIARNRLTGDRRNFYWVRGREGALFTENQRIQFAKDLIEDAIRYWDSTQSGVEVAPSIAEAYVAEVVEW